MDESYIQIWSRALRDHGIPLEHGLTDQEFLAVESAYHFSFPPDLKALLRSALPVGDHLPNWRSGPEADLRKRLAWPLEGILFDVEHNDFWLPQWGERPRDLPGAKAVAGRAVGDAPVLVPIFSHRYIPSEPPLRGNPVLSVYQTDIIYYGFDLASYFQREFHVPPPKGTAEAPRPVRFWDEIIRMNDLKGS